MRVPLFLLGKALGRALSSVQLAIPLKFSIPEGGGARHPVLFFGDSIAVLLGFTYVVGSIILPTLYACICWS